MPPVLFGAHAHVDALTSVHSDASLARAPLGEHTASIIWEIAHVDALTSVHSDTSLVHATSIIWGSRPRACPHQCAQ
jgi:hypothetical protein